MSPAIFVPVKTCYSINIFYKKPKTSNPHFTIVFGWSKVKLKTLYADKYYFHHGHSKLKVLANDNEMYYTLIICVKNTKNVSIFLKYTYTYSSSSLKHNSKYLDGCNLFYKNNYSNLDQSSNNPIGCFHNTLY